MSFSKNQLLHIAAAVHQNMPATSHYLPLPLSPDAEDSETIVPHTCLKSRQLPPPVTASRSSNIPVSAAPAESTDVWMHEARESSLKSRKANQVCTSAVEKMALQLLASELILSPISF